MFADGRRSGLQSFNHEWAFCIDPKHLRKAKGTSWKNCVTTIDMIVNVAQTNAQKSAKESESKGVNERTFFLQSQTTNHETDRKKKEKLLTVNMVED